MSEQGADDGGAGDHEDCAKENGGWPFEAQEAVGCDSGDGEGDDGTECDEHPDDAAGGGVFGEVECQAALE